MVLDPALDALFDATIEATEEAIVNALVAAETMTGRDGNTAFALPHDRLVAAMAAADGSIGRRDRPAGDAGEDLDAIARISVANDEPVADPNRPGSRYLEHLLRVARLVVAETDAVVVGFAGDDRHPHRAGS